MKKVFQTAFLTLVAVSVFVVTANAESRNANFNNIIESPAAVFNYQGSEDNPIKDTVTDIFKIIRENQDIHLTLSDLKTVDLFNNVFLSNNVSLVVVDADYNGLTYLLLETSNTDFDKIIDTITEFEGLEETKYNDNTIYSSYKRESFALTFHNGSTIITESVTQLKEVLDKLETDSLNMDRYEDKFQNDYFFSGIVFEELTSALNSSSYGQNLPSGDVLFSVKQSARNTYQIESFTAISENQYQKLGIDINSTTFTPELYSVLPGDNVAFYIEFNNITTAFSGALDAALASDPYLASDFNSIINNPVLDIFDGKTALLLQFQPNNVIPNATLITENTSASLTTSANEKISQLIQEATYQETSQEISEFNVFEYDINQDVHQVYFEEASNFSLHFGQIDEYYVISTNPNIQSELGTNTLADNSSFMNNLDEALNSNNVTSLSYINPSNSVDYINYIYSNFENEINADEKEYYYSIMDIIENLNSSYSYSTYDNGEVYSFAQLSVPMSELIDLSLNATLQFSGYTSNYYYNRLTDVDDSKWYASDLKIAVKNGIIKGKEGPNYTYYFDASGTTTRAEFVTMLLRHYNLEWESAQLGSSIFTDIDNGTWYDKNIGIAHAVGIISETNGKFRPKEDITRAEAIQMIKNFSGVLYKVDSNENPFSDVSNRDSFAEAVKAAYAKGIVTGTTPTTFEPYKNLNRAEAVAILNRVAEREFNFFQ